MHYPLPTAEGSSTLLGGYNAVREGLKAMAKDVVKSQSAIEAQCKSFIEMRHKQSHRKRECEKSVAVSKKELDRAQQNLKSVKKHYDSACRKAEKAITTRDEAKRNASDPKVQAKIPKFEKSAASAIADCKKYEAQYCKAVVEVRNKQKAHRRNTFKAMNDLQVVDTRRITASKQMLSLFVEMQLRIAKTMNSFMEIAKKKVDAVDPDADIDMFIARAKQESKLKVVPPLQLQDYKFHNSPLLTTAGVTSTFVAPSDHKPPVPGGGAATPQPPGGPSVGPPRPPKVPPVGPPPVGPARPPPGPTDAKVTGTTKPPPVQPPTAPPPPMEEPAAVPTPPAIPSADRRPSVLNNNKEAPTDPESDEPTSAGGAAPALPAIPSAPPKPPSESKSNEPGALVVAKAEYDFKASEDTDLGFDVDDYIIIQDRSDSEWWTGYFPGQPGKIGEFPANYVKIVQDPAAGMYRQVTGLYDYDAAEDGDLTFQTGDEIDLLDDSEQGWWEGMLNNTATGRFPANYVELVSSKAKKVTGR